jgi:hypothetical protein
MGTPTRMACPEDMVRLPTSLSSPYLPFDSSNLNLQMHEVCHPFVASLEACRGCYGDLSGHAEPGFKGDSGRMSSINLSPSLFPLELMSCSDGVVAATQESSDPWEALRVVELVRGHEEKKLDSEELGRHETLSTPENVDFERAPEIGEQTCPTSPRAWHLAHRSER